MAQPLRPYPPPSSFVAKFFRNFFFSSFKKSYFFLVARPLRGGKGQATKKKELFFEAREKKFRKNVATKLEKGGVRP